MTSQSRILTRDELIGQRIVEIRQESRFDDNGLDWVTSYFVLETGVTFTLPMEDATEVSSEEVPPGCEPLEHPRLIHLIGQKIADVLRVRDNAACGAESLLLRLENQHLVADFVVAHSGTGCAGIHLYQPDDLDLNSFESIWPTEKSRLSRQSG